MRTFNYSLFSLQPCLMMPRFITFRKWSAPLCSCIIDGEVFGGGPGYLFMLFLDAFLPCFANLNWNFKILHLYIRQLYKKIRIISMHYKYVLSSDVHLNRPQLVRYGWMLFSWVGFSFCSCIKTMNSCLYNYCLFSWPFQKLDIKLIKGNWNIAIIGISNRQMYPSTNWIFTQLCTVFDIK